MPNFKLKQTSEQVQKAIDNALYPDKELTKEGVPADSKSVGIEIKKNSIHIGTEPPENGETVWIDTDEEPEENGGGSGGTSIDVTAEVGQTIVVKEIDANGKPTKWESADYQPRTHYTAEAEILPETTYALDGDVFVLGTFILAVGDTYKVTWDGMEYECVAVDFSAMQAGMVALGNLGSFGLEDTGEPFVIMSGDAFGGTMGRAEDDTATSATVKITGNVDVQIPEKYIPNSVYPYFVNIMDEGNRYTTLKTQAELKSAIDANQHVMAKLTLADGDICIGHLIYARADVADARFITGTPNQSIIYLTATDDGYYTVSVDTN